MKRTTSFVLLLFLAGVVVAAFVAYAAVKENKRNKQIEDLISSLEQEKERIRIENNSLKEKIAYLDTAQFQEKIAKEKLNMQNPGEKVVIVKQGPINQEAGPQQSDNSDQKEEKIPNYAKWYDHFFAY